MIQMCCAWMAIIASRLMQWNTNKTVWVDYQVCGLSCLLLLCYARISFFFFFYSVFYPRDSVEANLKGKSIIALTTKERNSQPHNYVLKMQHFSNARSDYDLVIIKIARWMDDETQTEAALSEVKEASLSASKKKCRWLESSETNCPLDGMGK